VKSIGQIARLQRIGDNDAKTVAARDMLAELLQDNRSLAEEMRALHALCDRAGGVATASLIESWIDEAARGPSASLGAKNVRRVPLSAPPDRAEPFPARQTDAEVIAACAATGGQPP
jgi:hypothetical protein